MKALIEIANQTHALEKKAARDTVGGAQYARHLQRLRQALTDLGVTYHDPEGERYTDARTDIEASLTGEPGDTMTITQVIKPIVMQDGQIVQQGIVIVEGR